MMQHAAPTAPAVAPFRRLGYYESISTPPIQLVKNAIFAQAVIGDRIAPGIRVLSDQSGVSRGMISECLYQLDREGWIVYDGRTITLVRDPDVEPEGDRSIDRSPDSAAIDRSIDQKRAPKTSDRSIDRSHCDERDQPQQDAVKLRTSRDRVQNVCMESLITTTSSLDPVVVETSRARAVMAKLGAEPPIITDAFASRPDWTAEQVRARWTFDQERIAASDGRLNDGVFFHALRRGQLAPQPRTVDWGTYVQAQAASPPDDDPDPPGESPQQHAARIAPADCSGRDMLFLVQQLAQHASDAAALAALASRGKRGGR